jgi:hypothetical protein
MTCLIFPWPVWFSLDPFVAWPVPIWSWHRYITGSSLRLSTLDHQSTSLWQIFGYRNRTLSITASTRMRHTGFTALRRDFLYINHRIMFTNDNNSVNRPNAPQKYCRLPPINTLTTPTIPVLALQEDYTPLSPITLQESLETSHLLSETSTSHQITINASHLILPTLPPSAQFNESFDVLAAPGDWWLRSVRMSKEEKLKSSLRAVDKLLEDLSTVYEIDSIGKFLRLLFYLPNKDTFNHCSRWHVALTACFLSGKNAFCPSDLIAAIYNHRYSFPSWEAVNIHEREYAFSTEMPLDEIHFAQPALSSWAARIAGE